MTRKNWLYPLFLLLIVYSCISEKNKIVRDEYNDNKDKHYLSAFYHGTQSQATIEFKNNHRFYLKSSGFLSPNEWQAGNWKYLNDTFYLEYDSGKSPIITGTKMPKDSNYLYVFNKLKDSVNYRPLFRIFKKQMGKIIRLDDYD